MLYGSNGEPRFADSLIVRIPGSCLPPSHWGECVRSLAWRFAIRKMALASSYYFFEASDRMRLVSKVPLEHQPVTPSAIVGRNRSHGLKAFCEISCGRNAVARPRIARAHDVQRLAKPVLEVSLGSLGFAGCVVDRFLPNGSNSHNRLSSNALRACA
jgi:hypothetical protein